MIPIKPVISHICNTATEVKAIATFFSVRLQPLKFTNPSLFYYFKLNTLELYLALWYFKKIIIFQFSSQMLVEKKLCLGIQVKDEGLLMYFTDTIQ